MTDAAAGFLDRHRDAQHPYLGAVRAAFASGTCQLTIAGDHLGSCDELLHIYRRRADHLAQFHANHPVALRRDVLAFCSNLERLAGERVCWWSFEMPDGVSFLFVEHPPSGVIVGYLRTVSKLRVSDATWRELWGDAG